MKRKKKKGQKNFDLPELGFEPQIFMGSEGDDKNLGKEVKISRLYVDGF